MKVLIFIILKKKILLSYKIAQLDIDFMLRVENLKSETMLDPGTGKIKISLFTLKSKYGTAKSY